MESDKDTLFPSLPGFKPQEEVKDKPEVAEELDYDSMFAAMESTDANIIHASQEDGVVDVRDLLGKCGRDTQADKPNLIITETSKEKQNQAKSHLPDYIEEAKMPIDYSK